MPCASSFPSKKGCVITCQLLLHDPLPCVYMLKNASKLIWRYLKQAVLGSCISCQQPLDRPCCNDLPTVCISRVPFDAIIFQYVAMEGISAITNLSGCEQQRTSSSLAWLYVWQFAPLSRQIIGHIVSELVCTLTSEFKCANIISRKYARNQTQPLQSPATCLCVHACKHACMYVWLYVYTHSLCVSTPFWPPYEDSTCISLHFLCNSMFAQHPLIWSQLSCRPGWSASGSGSSPPPSRCAYTCAAYPEGGLNLA